MAARQQQSDWQFPFFADLPTELREMIWRACLPHRVSELDHPEDWSGSWSVKDEKVDYSDIARCIYWKSSIENVKPPTITRVCRESRQVAFRAGQLLDWNDDSRYIAFRHPPPMEWIDHKRNSPFIAYNTVEEDWDWCLEVPWPDDPLGRLATAVDMTSSPGSFYVELLSGHRSGPGWPASIGRPNSNDPPITGSPQLVPLGGRFDLPVLGPIDFEPENYTFRENKEKYTAMKRHAEWLVVMETVIIHCVPQAIATGLFGVYGDAPIQIIKTDEEHKIEKLFDLLAETDKCESVIGVQRFWKQTPQHMRSRLRGVIWAQQYPDELAERLKPAIMFRLCKERCNEKRQSEMPQSPSNMMSLPDI